MTVRHNYNSYEFLFSSRRRHTRLQGDWSSDVCSSDLRCGRCIPTSGHESETRQVRFRACVAPIFAIVVAVLTAPADRKSTRLNSSHLVISYAVFCLKKKM